MNNKEHQEEEWARYQRALQRNPVYWSQLTDQTTAKTISPGTTINHSKSFTVSGIIDS